jgi:hypothetical protein
MVFQQQGPCAVCWWSQIGWEPYPASAGEVTKHLVTALYTEYDDEEPEEFQIAGNKFTMLFDEYHSTL